MLEKLKKLKENTTLRIIGSILYMLMFAFVALLLIIVIMQRVTDNNITIGGIRMFAVETGSMKPVYEIGDVIISKEIDPEKIEVGDDIVYLGEKGSFAGKIITHRVNLIEQKEDGNYRIITQGIANEMEDPEIDQTQVIGKVVLKMYILSFLEKIVRNVYVFYFVVFIPIGILVYKNIKAFTSYDDYDDDDEEKEKQARKKK